MALNAVVEKRLSDGSATKVIGSFVWDNSYPSGGYTYRPAIFGLSQVYAMNVPELQDTSMIVDLDPNSNRIRIYSATGGNTVLYQEVVRAIDPIAKSCDYATAIYGNFGSISCVWATNGATPGPRILIPATSDGTTPSVPVAGEVFVNRSNGKLQFSTVEDATSCVFGITSGNGSSPLFLEIAPGTDVDGLYSPVQFEVVGV